MKIQPQNPLRPGYIVIQRLALALALLVVGGIITYSLYQEHERIEQRERERLLAQTRVIDENLARQLDVVYRTLEGIRKELLLWRGRDAIKLANRHLSAMADAMPGFRTFLIVDATGQIIACNRKQIIGQNIRQRDYFQVPFKNPSRSTLYISPPFKTTLGNFVINVGLMIQGPKGEFAGVITASLNQDYFSILLGSVLYAPDMRATLAHGDGKLFLRVPNDGKGLTGLDLASHGDIKSGRQATQLPGTVVPADEERLTAQRTIKPGNIPMDKALVVAVSRGLSAMYTNWRREAFVKAVLFGVLALAMTSALYLYQRRQRKFEAISARYLNELLRAKDAALHANEAKSRFLVTAAHEFRTPLSLLTSSTDILDRYGERLSSEERIQQHDHIRNAARQLSGMVDSVLSFNRLDAHSSPNVPVVVDVGIFCKKLAEEVKTACSKGHEFSVSIADDCGIILLDEALFRRIVENLLTNAFRYTPIGGTVSLQVIRENNQLRVIVTDSGIGIPEEEQKQIFEAFYRCRNVEARRGLGLGLSIVQDALSRMGGIITVDSTVGEGTTMRMEIPIVDQSYQVAIKMSSRRRGE